VVLMTLLGGMGAVLGPIVGVFVVVMIEDYFASLGEWGRIIMGCIFVFCVLVFRRGSVGAAGRRPCRAPHCKAAWVGTCLRERPCCFTNSPHHTGGLARSPPSLSAPASYLCSGEHLCSGELLPARPSLQCSKARQKLIDLGMLPANNLGSVQHGRQMLQEDQRAA
jgi:hypothetical protein